MMETRSLFLFFLPAPFHLKKSLDLDWIYQICFYKWIQQYADWVLGIFFISFHLYILTICKVGLKIFAEYSGSWVFFFFSYQGKNCSFLFDLYLNFNSHLWVLSGFSSHVELWKKRPIDQARLRIQVFYIYEFDIGQINAIVNNVEHDLLLP